MSSVNNNGIHQQWPKIPQEEQVTSQSSGREYIKVNLQNGSLEKTHNPREASSLKTIHLFIKKFKEEISPDQALILKDSNLLNSPKYEHNIQRLKDSKLPTPLKNAFIKVLKTFQNIADYMENGGKSQSEMIKKIQRASGVKFHPQVKIRVVEEKLGENQASIDFSAPINMRDRVLKKADRHVFYRNMEGSKVDTDTVRGYVRTFFEKQNVAGDSLNKTFGSEDPLEQDDPTNYNQFNKEVEEKLSDIASQYKLFRPDVENDVRMIAGYFNDFIQSLPHESVKTLNDLKAVFKSFMAEVGQETESVDREVFKELISRKGISLETLRSPDYVKFKEIYNHQLNEVNEKIRNKEFDEDLSEDPQEKIRVKTERKALAFNECFEKSVDEFFEKYGRDSDEGRIVDFTLVNLNQENMGYYEDMIDQFLDSEEVQKRVLEFAPSLNSET